MKKVVIIVVAILCCIALGVGVYFLVNRKENTEEKCALYIKQTAFSGASSQEEWEAQEKANKEKENMKYEIEKGKKINLTGMTGTFEIEVIECSEDEIKVKTSMEMSIEENGVMDLVKTKNEFTVKKNEKIRLITPTMDAYDMYEIEYR